MDFIEALRDAHPVPQQFKPLAKAYHQSVDDHLRETAPHKINDPYYHLRACDILAALLLALRLQHHLDAPEIQDDPRQFAQAAETASRARDRLRRALRDLAPPPRPAKDGDRPAGLPKILEPYLEACRDLWDPGPPPWLAHRAGPPHYTGPLPEDGCPGAPIRPENLHRVRSGQDYFEKLREKERREREAKQQASQTSESAQTGETSQPAENTETIETPDTRETNHQDLNAESGEATEDRNQPEVEDTPSDNESGEATEDRSQAEAQDDDNESDPDNPNEEDQDPDQNPDQDPGGPSANRPQPPNSGDTDPKPSDTGAPQHRAPP